MALTDGVYPRYEGSVFRPPSEADSLILQVMYGCSYGQCTFCGMYLDKRFRLRSFQEVKEDVQNLDSALKANVTRVFLADGDALAVPARSMLRILGLLATELPGLERVSSYANAHSLLKRSEEELRAFREHGLEMLYVGLESGDEKTLERTCKGVTVAQTIEACHKAKRAGLSLSVMAILGLGGADRPLEHARGTGKALSDIDPDFISLLTLMLVPGTPLVEAIELGESALPGPEESLRELRDIIAATEVTDAVFRTTHASNYLAIEGKLPEDKAAMLEVIDKVLTGGGGTWLRPESLRRL
jgi:radical SAM superfamily enzyme YgiQ (UPF0313 family)